ncbi:MAG: hypothetical protein HC841_08150 [Verrucomicrobiae bacterium]|nr:hypothetical protein [Verrucomicrobiae bacterium]
MSLVDQLEWRLRRHPKRIVFPEGTETRVLQAARQYYSLRLGVPILLGDRAAVKDAAARLNVSLRRRADHHCRPGPGAERRCRRRRPR